MTNINISPNPVYALDNETALGYPGLGLVDMDVQFHGGTNGSGSFGTAGSDTVNASMGHPVTDAEYGSPPLLKQSPPMVAVFTTAYGVVLFLAVVNNCLVVTAIRRNQNLRTITNMFVANLAIADITVSLLVLPITLLSNLFTGTYHDLSTSETPNMRTFIFTGVPRSSITCHK